MIVRLLGGDGQFRLADETRAELNELDDEAVAAVEADDEQKLRALLEQMAAVVQRGERLDDADLAGSDLVIPPSDLTLEEARELFTGEGLIPDLPAA